MRVQLKNVIGLGLLSGVHTVLVSATALSDSYTVPDSLDCSNAALFIGCPTSR